MYQLSSSTSRENVYGNTVHIGRRIDREMERNDQSEKVLGQAETSRQTAGGSRGVNTRAETAARAKDTTLKQTSSTKLLGGIIFAGSRHYHSVTTGYTAGFR